MKILIAGYPALTMNYRRALSACGLGCTISLPQTHAALSDFDALLLPGGGDIAPDLFGQSDNGSRSIDRALDIAQLGILDYFVTARKPVLGICKGMQLINIYFGGGIIQHLPTASRHAFKNGDLLHPTEILSGSFLYSLYGPHIIVNSAHHQGLGALGKDLTLIQRALDNVPEAICHNSLPIRAVQWHPERMCKGHANSNTADGSLIFASFVQLIESGLDI